MEFSYVTLCSTDDLLVLAVRKQVRLHQRVPVMVVTRRAVGATVLLRAMKTDACLTATSLEH